LADAAAAAPAPLVYPALHGLRGLAAGWVVLFHLSATFPAFGPALTHHLGAFVGGFLLNFVVVFGWVGVALFFALSGFLLGGQWLARPGQSFGAYTLRRAARIYPAAWLQLAVLSLLLPWLPDGLLPVGQGIGWWFGQISLGFDLPPLYVRPLNGVWWTLPVELSFYLILPALVWLLGRIGAVALLVLGLLLSIGWRWAVILGHPGDNKLEVLAPLNSLPGSLSIFVAGVVVAHWFLARPRPDLHWSWLALAAWLALAGWMLRNLDSYWAGGWPLASWNALAGLLMAAVVWLAAGRRGWLAGAAGHWAGERSYGIYLWHMPILMLQKASLPELGLGSSILLALGLTGLAAEISYRLVERPAMRWAKRRTPPILKR